MKKILISTLGLFACASAFAELGTNEYEGVSVTGDYTANELVKANGGSNTFTNILLDGSISITDSTSITTTDTTNPMGTSGKYSIKVGGVSNGAGNAVLSLEEGSTGSFNIGAGIVSYRGGPLTINVAKTAEGYVNTGTVTAQYQPVTLNVNKDYGIRDSETDNFFTASVVGTLNINATADLAISIDIRSETSLLDVNLTDGANLYINLLKIQTTASTVGVNIQNDLSDGMILFDKNMVASDFTYVGLDEDGSKIFNLGVKKGTKTQTFKITFDDGVDTSNITWDDTLVDGYYALYSVSAVPEPAEWAMIFGALALGLAIYKRRK